MLHGTHSRRAAEHVTEVGGSDVKFSVSMRLAVQRRMNQLHYACSTNMVAIDNTQDLVIEITARKDTFGLRQFG